MRLFLNFSRALSLPIAAVLFLPFASRAAPVTLASPERHVTATLSVTAEQRLVYSLNRNGTPVVEASPLGIVVDGVDLGAGVSILRETRSARNATYPWRGVKSQATDRANELAIEIEHAASGQRWILEARAYDDAFAFRYIVPGDGRRRMNGEATAWVLPAGTAAWYCTNTMHYEGEYEHAAIEKIPLMKTELRGETPHDSAVHVGFPITLELPDGTFAALAEADIMGYSGMSLRPSQSSKLNGVFEDDPDGWEMDGPIRSPWRITMTGPDLNALVNCDVMSNVCPPPDPDLFPKGMAADWIKPGRSLWQWWAYDNAGTHWSTQKRFVDQAALLGCDYYLVDEGWEHTRQEWFAPGETAWARMKELCDYAKTKGVAIWAWRAWDYNVEAQFPGLLSPEQREDFFRRCAEAGIVGVKIDFMNSESHDRLEFYRDCLQRAARHRIMINFHGANKPAGEPRTWPHEMTREGVMGLEHNKWSALPPQHYATLPFTRYLAGHGDFTPFTLQPAFLKGTTAALQLATSVLYTSPFLSWADQPELYQAHPDIVAFMRGLPTVWDETLVLPGSRIGKLAGLARRHGRDWFVAWVNGSSQEPKEFQMALPFLKAASYRVDFYRDDPTDAAVIRHHSVNAEKALDHIPVTLQPGGGFVAVFRPTSGAD